MNKPYNLSPKKGAFAFFMSILTFLVVSQIVMLVSAIIYYFVTLNGNAFDLVALATVLEQSATLSPIQYAGMASIQFSILAVCAVVLNFNKEGLKQCCFGGAINKKDTALVCGLSVGNFFGLTIFAGLFMLFLQLFGYTAVDVPMPSFEGPVNFILGTIVVCILPAIAEELLHRGIILNSLRQYGKWKAILISSLAFTFMHASPLQTVYQFILGVIFALVVWKTGNIFYSMLMHFLNNFFVVLVTALGFADLQFPAYLVVIGIAICVLTITILCKKPDALEKIEVVDITKVEYSSDERINGILLHEAKIKAKGDKTMTIVCYAIPFAYCIGVWIMQFIMGLNI